MKSTVSDAINGYVEELKRFYPDIEVVVLPGRKVRVKVRPPLDVGEVLDKAAELQNRWILEHDIYIQVSVTGTGPIPIDG